MLATALAPATATWARALRGSRRAMGRAALALAGAFVLCCQAAHAQDYPSRPIRFIVPYPPGGAADLFARTIAPAMGESLGKQVFIDNRPGANGIVGTELAAKAAPDGYTIYMGAKDALVLNPTLYDKVPYDPVKDFAPISQGSAYPYVLIGNAGVSAATVPELIALAKARPGEVAYASPGFGSSPHLAGEFLAQAAGVKLLHVTYKGSGPALTAVLSGEVPLMFNTISVALPHLKAGKVRAYAITGRKRSPVLPDVPTMDELGLKNYEVTQWQGVLAPAGTPRPIVEKLHRAVVHALRSKEVVDLLGVQGNQDLVGSTPEGFAALIGAELASHAKLVKETGLRVQELQR